MGQLSWTGLRWSYLPAVAGMMGFLSTLASRLPAGWLGCSHGGGLRVPGAARGEPSYISASQVCFLSLAASPLTKAIHMFKPRVRAGGDHPKL